MRRIKKQAPPADLARFVRRENPQKFEEIHDSQHFPKLYDECIVQLETEQENLSGYVDGLPEAEREKAEFTIKAFNLRHKLLTLLQGDAIRLVRTYKAQGLEYDEIMNALKDYGFTSAVEYALTEGPLPKDAGSLSQ